MGNGCSKVVVTARTVVDERGQAENTDYCPGILDYCMRQWEGAELGNWDGNCSRAGNYSRKTAAQYPRWIQAAVERRSASGVVSESVLSLALFPQSPRCS